MVFTALAKVDQLLVDLGIVQNCNSLVSAGGNEVDGKSVEGFVESAEPLGHEIYYATVIDRRYRVGSRVRRRSLDASDNGPR